MADDEQTAAAAAVDGGGMLDSVSSFVGRAATAASSVIPKAASPSAPAAAASLADLARNADAGETASAIASAAFAGKMGVAALSASGVGLPIAGALGAVMLVAYTANKMIKENAKLQGVLADVLTIISNCYTIDRLIDRTLGICTIAMFGNQGDVTKLLTQKKTVVASGGKPNIDGGDDATKQPGENSNADGETRPQTPQTSLQQKEGTAAAAAAPLTEGNTATVPEPTAESLTPAAVANAAAAAVAVVEFNEEMYQTLLAGALTAKKKAYTENLNLTLMKLIAPSQDLKERLMDKLKLLTTYLLKITPDDVLAALVAESSAAGFTSAKEERDRRQGNSMVWRRLGKISRGMSRMSDGAELQREMIKELTVIEGLFMLVKAQFDATMNFYSANMENWSAVREAIENTAEFRDYLVPKDLKKVVKDIDKNKDVQQALSTTVQEKKEEEAKQEQEQEQQEKGDEVRGSSTTGGGRTRRRQELYMAKRRSGTYRRRGYL